MQIPFHDNWMVKMMKSNPEKFLNNIFSESKEIRHYCYSVWLFTASDISTTIIPATLFALFTATTLYDTSSFWSVDSIHTFKRLPFSTLWVWMNLLLGVIGNQRKPEAVEEDRINKPWRTLPSGRMTIEQAVQLERILYPSVVLVSLKIGGVYETVSLIILGIWYNKMGGADRHFVERNLINVFGFTSFNSGALQVLLGSDPDATRVLRPWLLVVAAVVMTTVQIQDLRDQAGDALSNRSTMPLILGDLATRWLTLSCILLWTAFVPYWWGLSIVASLPFLALGGFIAVRTLFLRDPDADQLTFTMWCIWLVVIYAIPVFGSVKLSVAQA